MSLEYYIKKSIQALSYNSNGLTPDSLFSEIPSSLPPPPPSLLPSLLSSPYIEQRDGKLFLKGVLGVAEELSFFLRENEDKNEAIVEVYEEILKRGKQGVNYAELAKVVNARLRKKKGKNKLKALEINMISHYCRRLANCDLVEIRSKDNCKLVISKNFTKWSINKFTEKKRLSQTLLIPPSHSSFLPTSSLLPPSSLLPATSSLVPSSSLIPSPYSSLLIPPSSRLPPSSYFLPPTSSFPPRPTSSSPPSSHPIFYFQGLTFKQNLLINLMSEEANNKKGLSLSELCEKLNKPGQTKMLNRFMAKLIPEWNIIATPDRKGRLYSFRYYIPNPSLMHPSSLPPPPFSLPPPPLSSTPSPSYPLPPSYIHLPPYYPPPLFSFPSPSSYPPLSFCSAPSTFYPPSFCPLPPTSKKPILNNECFFLIIGNCDRPDYQEAINKHLKDSLLIQQLSLLKQSIREEKEEARRTDLLGAEMKEEGGVGAKEEGAWMEDCWRRGEESIKKRFEEGGGWNEGGRRREEGEISPVYVPLCENLIKILVEMIEVPTSFLSKRQVSALKMSRFIYSLNVIYSEKLIAISKSIIKKKNEASFIHLPPCLLFLTYYLSSICIKFYELTVA